MLKMGNNAANDAYTKRCKESGTKIHPARFPALLPKFFIKLLTEENDLVVDPFAGSNTTGFRGGKPEAPLDCRRSGRRGISQGKHLSDLKKRSKAALSKLHCLLD